MTPIIDLYWSFRSPYSYLALKPTLALQNEWDVDINVKVVLPLALRQPSFFDSRGAEWMGYLMRDVFRLAQMSGQTIASPNPDPVTMDTSTGTFAKEQPLVTRLSRLGILASDTGHGTQNMGLTFLNEVSTLIWSGVQWDQGSTLSDAVALAGLNLTSLEENMDTEALDARLAQHDKDLRAAGHWGVPTFVLGGEPFFGQDRIDVLKWRLGQMGVKKRKT